MGMNMDSGEIRPLAEGEQPRDNEVVFKVGEKIEVKGCLFEITQVFPNPDNELRLKGQPSEAAKV